MTATKELTPLEKLRQPFDPKVIKWRPGNKSGDKALALAYVDARDVADRLDDAFGRDWSDRYMTINSETGAVECGISAWENDGRIVTRSDIGYPNAGGDIDKADREPLKAAYSDAFKRAGVKWGIGRDLYDTPQFWLPLNQYGRFDTLPVHNGKEWVLPGSGAATQQAQAQTGADGKASDGLRKKLLAKCTDKGLTEAQVKAMYMTVIDPKIRSSKDLTTSQVELLLGKLDDSEFVANCRTVEAVDVAA